MADDPVLIRRAQVGRLVVAGKRIGYSLYLVAIVLFVVGLADRFTDGLVQVIVACLVAGSLVLAPAIVFGYAVRAADREERRAAAAKAARAARST